MADIRLKSTKMPGLREGWMESVSSLKDLLSNRTIRVALKGKAFITPPAAANESVQVFEDQIRMCVDGDIEKGKYQQAHLKSKEGYQKFLKDHCVERHYFFIIRKCELGTCCVPKMTPDIFPTLPDPVMGQDGHYKPFAEVVGTETTEKDRPSSQVQTVKAVAEEVQGVRNKGLVAQNVRKVVKCYDCGKPRCVYSRTALSVREGRAFARLQEKHDYSCGALVVPEGDVLDGRVFVRLPMNCSTPVEFAYYSSSTGRPDICAQCGAEGAQKNIELLKSFSVVLPLCTRPDCIARGVLKRNPRKNKN